MILKDKLVYTYEEDLSRVCGDDPYIKAKIDYAEEFVPRMRG